MSGLKHPGVGPDWVRLRGGSEPEADQVITVIAFVGVEWGDLHCGTRGIIVCELAEWEELVPVVLLVVAVDLDILFQGLVSALSLPITFQMVIQGEV